MKIGLVFGGRSVEHEISIISASNIARSLENLELDVVYLFIDTDGLWFLIEKDRETSLKDALNFKKPISLNLSNFEPFNEIDLFFPIVHGTSGEDGCLQGFFELMNKPYVGPRVQASAICMDKELTKRILKNAGHLVVDYICLRKKEEFDTAKVQEEIGYPCFVKPASLGSSVGISKCYDAQDLEQAIKEAFSYDKKVLIEKGIVGEEVECAVIGGKLPQASLPVKLKPSHDFYSYEAKYIDPNGAKLEAPFVADDFLLKRIQQEAIEIYRLLGCESMSRVDFFLTEAGDLYLNEVNTLPGFTNISAFPKAWEVSGVGFDDLIEILITEAIFRFQSDQKISRNKLQDSKV